MLATIQILLTLACLGLLANGLLNGLRIRRDARLMARRRLPDPPPLISVCVPARNEARNIAACMESLAGQDYPNFELLVLDDCSEDDTGQVARAVAARHPNVRVLTGQPLAPGWIGKPHACRQLGEAARGQWLLFTDADTVFAPSALTRALRLALARRADLLSGLPGLHAETLWERLSVPMLALVALGGVSFELVTRLPQAWYGAASGAFLLFRREAYEAIGGHHAVKDRIVEDISLARAVKRAGRRLVMADVTRLVSCRMYTTFGEVWEGLTKNIYAACPGLQFLLVMGFLLGVFFFPWFSFLFGPALGWGSWASTVLPLVQIGAVAILQAAVDRRILGAPSLLDPLLTPFSALFLSLIALRSGSRHLLRQPTPWRARHYELWKK